MGMITRALEARSATTHPSDPAAWLVDMLSGGTSATGRSVTSTTALYASAVFACVRVLAETVGQLPLHVYRRLDGGGKERSADHWLYQIVRFSPNPEMTAAEFWETMMGHLVLRGNAYAEIVWNNAGKVSELWPLHPDKVAVKRIGTALVYEVTPTTGAVVPLPAEKVLHLRGLGSNGLAGYSPITLAREAIGLSLAAEEYGARFFGNSANPSGVLQAPKTLSDSAYERLKKSWSAQHEGLGKAHRVAILEEGLTWQQIGIAPDDAQFLETRKFQRAEIASIFRVPPHMIADLDRATFSNIEHQSLEFMTHSIMPYLSKVEQRVNLSLLMLDRRYFVEFLVAGILRGDQKSRYDAYAVGRQWGWLSANDVRELENQNPLPGDQGDQYMVPLNMVPAGQLDEPDPAPAGPPPAAGDQDTRSAKTRVRILRAWARVMADGIERLLKREEADVVRKAGKLLDAGDTAGAERWLVDYYAGPHRAYCERVLWPIVAGYADDLAADIVGEGAELPDGLDARSRELAGEMTARHCEESSAALCIAAKDGTIADRFTEWRDTRPGAEADRELTDIGRAVADFVAAAQGVG